MADLSRKTASIYINRAPAEEALKKLQAQADKLSLSINKGQEAGKGMVNEIKKLNTVKDSISSVQRQIDAGLKPSFNQLSAIVAKTRAELKRMSESDPGFAKKSKDLQNYSAEMKRLGSQIGAVKKEGGGIGKMLGQFGSVAAGYVGVTAAIGVVVKLVGGVVKLSDQLGDLRRVAGLTKDEANNLNQELLKIDTRTSGAGLLSIAIIAGKLGVAKDDIVSFSEAVDKLVITLGDELGGADEITTQLGKILNVFDGTITGDNISHLGNAIVDLANKGVATGAFIVDFTQRVSGIAKASNLSLASTLGLAAGFESLGLRSESSATALQKLLTTIGGDIPAAARIAGMPIKEFNKLFAEKPQEALLKYAEGLTKNKNSFAAIAGSFKDAGAEGARVVQTMLALGQKSDYLRSQIDIANVSIREQNALNDGAAIKQENLAGTIDRLGKAWDRLLANQKITSFFQGLVDILSGAMDGVNAFADAFRSVDEIRSDIQKKHEQGQADIGASVAQDMAGKTLAEQQRLADSYKAMYLSSQHKLSAFLKSGNKDLTERNRLLEQQDIDQKVYLATQKTLQDSIAAANKDAHKEVDADALKDKEVTKESENARLAALKKAAEDVRKLKEIWAEFSERIYDTDALLQDNPVSMAFKSANDAAKKDVAIAKNLYDKRIIDLKQYSDAITRIEEIRWKAFQDIAKKYKLVAEDPNYKPGAGISLAKPLDASKLSDNTQANEQLVKDQAKLFRNSLAGEELKSITSTGKKKLDAELNVLELQKAAELANKDLTENEKLLIEEKYRGKRKTATDNFHAELAENILAAAQQVSAIMDVFSAAQDNADNAKLAENQQRYDEDVKKLDRQLRQKLVNQKEYERQVRSLEDKKRKEDAVIKARQFERDKRAQIIQAIMNGAGAVISALKANPPLNFIFAGLATAMVAAQIATISAQKAPQFAKGGMLDGPAHKAGGMPIMRNGRKVAEVEGGEAILSKKTVRNNWDIVSELLKTSMYGNGARLIPYSQTRSKFRSVNYSSISKGMNEVRQFENGGILPGGVINNSPDSMIELSKGLAELNRTTNYLNVAISHSIETSVALNKKISEPFKSYNLLSDINANQQIMDRVINETTITRKRT